MRGDESLITIMLYCDVCQMIVVTVAGNEFDCKPNTT